MVDEGVCVVCIPLILFSFGRVEDDDGRAPSKSLLCSLWIVLVFPDPR